MDLLERIKHMAGRAHELSERELLDLDRALDEACLTLLKASNGFFRAVTREGDKPNLRLKVLLSMRMNEAAKALAGRPWFTEDPEAKRENGEAP